MTQVQLSSIARKDLGNILDYLRDVAGKHTRRRYLEEIRTSINLLHDFPDRGSLRPKWGGKTRVLIIRPYTIYYDREDEQVTVLRILHSARLVTTELIDEGRDD